MSGAFKTTHDTQFRQIRVGVADNCCLASYNRSSCRQRSFRKKVRKCMHFSVILTKNSFKTSVGSCCWMLERWKCCIIYWLSDQSNICMLLKRSPLCSGLKSGYRYQRPEPFIAVTLLPLYTNYLSCLGMFQRLVNKMRH